MNKEAWKEIIRQDPLKSSRYHFKILKRNKYQITLQEVKHILFDVQAEIFPKDIDLTFTPQLCKTLNQKNDEKQPFLIGRVQAPHHK